MTEIAYHHPQDLETLCMYLDIAAIYLTPEPGTGFTVAEVMREVRGLGGTDVDERDVAIVLDTYSAFQKLPGKRW